MIILKLLVVFGSYMLLFLFLRNRLAKYIYVIFGILISITTLFFVLIKTVSAIFSIMIPLAIIIYYYNETIFRYIKIQAFKQLVQNVDFSQLIEDTKRMREQLLLL